MPADKITSSVFQIRTVDRLERLVFVELFQILYSLPGQRREHELAVAQRLAAPVDAQIGGVRLHDAGIFVVVPHQIEDLERACFEIGIVDGEHKLHAAIEVAGHPVGAAHINFGVPGVFKPENAAVLEQLPDNAVDVDVFADVFQTRNQSAYAADNQVDRHTRL